MQALAIYSFSSELKDWEETQTEPSQRCASPKAWINRRVASGRASRVQSSMQTRLLWESFLKQARSQKCLESLKYLLNKNWWHHVYSFIKIQSFFSNSNKLNTNSTYKEAKWHSGWIGAMVSLDIPSNFLFGLQYTRAVCQSPCTCLPQ